MPPILEPFQFEFFIKGLVAATLAGGLCGLIGVYIVLRGMAYIGHGLSHAVFGGAVVSYIMSINFFVGASIWGFLSALLISLTTRKRVIGADAAIGIVTTASFALGIAIISTQRTFTRSFEAALIGDILGVERGDLVALTAVSIGTVVLVLIGYKLILFTTFDPEVARFYGVPTHWVDTAFSLVLAGVIVVSMQVLGVTMIAAAIVIPPIVARLITNKFSHMLVLSAAIGTLCGFFGIYISYWADVSSGATIVLFAAALFLLAMAWSSLRRWLPFPRAPHPL